MTKREMLSRWNLRYIFGHSGLCYLDDIAALERMRDVHRAYAEVLGIEAKQARLTVGIRKARIMLVRAVGGPE